MEAMPTERGDVRRGARVAGIVAYAGGAAFAVAAVWYALATRGVTLPSQPNPGATVTVAQSQRIFEAWLVTTLHQERLYTGIAIVGFLCLAAVAVFLRDSIGRDRVLAKLATMAIVIGGVLWIGGNVAHLGANRAVGLLSTHDYSPSTVSAVQFTADLVTEALEVTAFAIIGVGMLALGWELLEHEPASKVLGRVTWLLALCALVTSVSYLGNFGALTDLMLITTGAVLLPIWMVLSGRRLKEA